MGNNNAISSVNIRSGDPIQIIKKIRKITKFLKYVVNVSENYLT